MNTLISMFILFVTGVLQEGQQWEVYTEGPAGRPDAESPQIPSPSSGLSRHI